MDQQYVPIDDQLRWRTPDEQPPGMIRQSSPYDGDARAGTKRDSHWDGYKVHLTETCDTDAPHLITNVVTAPSPGSDQEATDLVQEAVAARGLTPAVHPADKGYMSAHNLTRADRRGIELLGPMMPDNAWQSAEGNSFAVSDCTIDWDNRVMTCPTGATSLPWANEIDQGGTPVVRVRFSMRSCKDCPSRDLCTCGAKGRGVTLRPQEEHEALQRARARQSTDEWQQRYAHRAGVEGTIAKASKALACANPATAGPPRPISSTCSSPRLNLTRLDAWLTGTLLAPTRTSQPYTLRHDRMVGVAEVQRFTLTMSAANQENRYPT
ncbi:transposase [Nonomuraea sp. NPDC003707]